MNPRVIVTTYDKAMWSIKPFIYLFNKFWSNQQQVDILCESIPTFEFPSNFGAVVINSNEYKGWPKEKWSNGLLSYLTNIDDKFIVILLDDYWLVRTVDVGGVRTLCDYMDLDSKILRIDLTADRLYAGGVKDVDMYGHYDIIEAPQSQYQMSLQVGIWNRTNLIKILQNDWSAWDVELIGTGIVNESDMRVLGTRQNLIRYANGMKNGSDKINTEWIPEEHKKIIERWFPK